MPMSVPTAPADGGDEHTCQRELLIHEVPCRLVALCGGLEPGILDDHAESQHNGPRDDEDAIDGDVR
jgi:hypothetical protein